MGDATEVFDKVFYKEHVINPLYCVKLLGYTWVGGTKFTNTKLQTLFDKDRILLFENVILGVTVRIMGSRYVESNENEKVYYVNAFKLNICAMVQNLRSDELNLIKLLTNKMFWLVKILVILVTFLELI